MIEKLEEHLILTFTGKSRRSSLTNWQAVRGYIDGKKGIVDRMARIRKAALDMREAILKGSFKRAADALREEWEARKRLAEGMVTSKIKSIMSAAKGAGAWASKVCGAGGGGSVVTFVKPERRERVIRAVEKVGGRVLDFKIARGGLKISEL
jgi:D-glycero-alpha-D-manno-heptose-7-phosphate kinase